MNEFDIICDTLIFLIFTILNKNHYL